MTDNINPKHYRQYAHECIEFTQHLNFNLGNAFKYIWRHKEKNGREDLEKAIWYLERQRVDAPKFKKLKDKHHDEMYVKLCAVPFDTDTRVALSAVLDTAKDCTKDNISWAIVYVIDLLEEMPSETAGKNA